MNKKTIWIVAGAAAVLVIGGAGVAVAATDPFDQDNDRLTGSALTSATEAALAEVGEGTVSEAERSDDLDHAYTVEVRLDNGDDVDVELDEDFDVVRVDGVVPGTSTGSGSSESNTAAPSDGATNDATNGVTNGAVDDNAPISDADRASAEQAALAEIGSGTVTDLDRSDDADHAWEVEITNADGTDVDVELDADFTVVRVDDDQR
ncbi:putative membrane protein YkoI [Conyzicola lurida]|uniref:Putative membrane protein YkoI n=1 Tax=Conyzicola lurida TaxID=1172621 RepID=A0A841ANN3_9MICO|nr:PepSY domain-containing protein [Conyzicola lurida]MBB5843029.1 putative membrane protein YkoI [Conyzicola lurida]